MFKDVDEMKIKERRSWVKFWWKTKVKFDENSWKIREKVSRERRTTWKLEFLKIHVPNRQKVRNSWFGTMWNMNFEQFYIQNQEFRFPTRFKPRILSLFRFQTLFISRIIGLFRFPTCFKSRILNLLRFPTRFIFFHLQNFTQLPTNHRKI